jgi:glycosyltransferase involved in cell wall biosynthesis
VIPFRLSVILLAYNEESSIAAAIDDAVAYLRRHGGDHEVIVVDDGSTDGTARVALAAKEKYPEVQIVTHPRNLGMGEGIRTGAGRASKDYFTVLAADGQVKAAEIDKMIPLCDGTNLVLSRYVNRPDGLLRKLYSWGFRACMWATLGIRLPLEGIYLFPVALLRTRIDLQSLKSHSFLLSFELIDQAVKGGARYALTSIECVRRQSGRSKVTGPARIARMVGEMLTIRRLSRLPDPGAAQPESPRPE